MDKILRGQFDQSYFDGASAEYSHNGGYTQYVDGQIFEQDALLINEGDKLQGKSILEIGCAKGFLLKSLYEQGVTNITGVDFSYYAIGEADPLVSDFLINEEALVFLQSKPDLSYDYCILRYVVECLDDNDLAVLIPEINRVCSKSIVICSSFPNSRFYNVKTESEWCNLPWSIGSEIYVDYHKTVIE